MFHEKGKNKVKCETMFRKEWNVLIRGFSYGLLVVTDNERRL